MWTHLGVLVWGEMDDLLLSVNARYAGLGQGRLGNLGLWNTELCDVSIRTHTQTQTHRALNSHISGCPRIDGNTLSRVLAFLSLRKRNTDRKIYAVFGRVVHVTQPHEKPTGKYFR